MLMTPTNTETKKYTHTRRGRESTESGQSGGGDTPIAFPMCTARSMHVLHLLHLRAPTRRGQAPVTGFAAVLDPSRHNGDAGSSLNGSRH
jgi:hypothetical protein